MADGKVVIDTEIDSSGAKKDMNALGSALKKAGSTTLKGTIAAAGAATTAIAALSKAAVDSYAEYEQLVGGVDTLFKKSSETVQKYADEAYKTAGLSANAYMETVTSFSASLIKSLDGDTKKSADYANQAIVDMSDNANKMGSSMESIQNAYQGFAKQNYTMLDNLKLGYGGTKGEMQRLLSDAEELTGKKFDISNFGDITQAIHAIQVEMGIAGTTSKEASSTIQGSIGMMQSAWQNLLTSMSDPNSDFEKLMGNFIDSVLTVSENITPVILRTIPQVVSGLVEIINQIGSHLPDIILQLLPVLFDGIGVLLTSAISMLPSLITMLPELLDCGIQLIMTLLTGLTQQTPLLINTIIDVVFKLVDMVLLNLPLLIDAGLQLIVALAQGLIQALPEIIAKVPVLLDNIILAITSLLPLIVDAGILLFTSLIDELPVIIDALVVAIPLIVNSLVNYLSKNHTQMIDAGYKLFVAIIKNLPLILANIIVAIGKITSSIVSSLISAIPKLAETGMKLLKNIVGKVGEIKTYIADKISTIVTSMKTAITNKISEFKTIGKNIVQGLWSGIKDMKETVTKNVSDFFGGIVDSAKKKLKIKSPSRIFFEIGRFIDEGAINGIRSLLGEARKAGTELSSAIYDASSEDIARRQINNAMMTNTSALQSVVYSSAPSAGNFYQTVNVNQKVSTPDELARQMRTEARYTPVEGLV